MNPLIQLKRITPTLLIALLLVCPGLSPRAQAVSPPPDGGYPNENTAEGDGALFSLTTGAANTAIGFEALFNNTNGTNTAIGWRAMYRNTSGLSNTAIGVTALLSNTTGDNNTAIGDFALAFNTTGFWNTATGGGALGFNTRGFENTANGLGALGSNTTGDYNTASGSFALGDNRTGSQNTATGDDALGRNNGNNNTATGANALFSNTTGTQNTATGLNALYNNTTGENNTANGLEALEHNIAGGSNTASGQKALHRNITGSFNIALGAEAGANLTTGDNNIDIGNQGVGDESNTIRVGTPGTQTKTFIAGIRDTVIEGMEVRVNQNGRLGTVPSSKRFKAEIKPMDKASEAILALKPVTFRYKEEIDPERAPQFGLVAEDVEKVNPDLVVRDADGKVYSVRYEAVNAMLLNEFLKEHRKNEEQQATIAQLKSGMEALTATVKEQAAQIQKVSAQLDLSKTAPQTVLNSRYRASRW